MKTSPTFLSVFSMLLLCGSVFHQASGAERLATIGGGFVPDMLTWICHNYRLHCQHAGDRNRMRNGLFPLLRKVENSCLNYLKDNPVKADDGKVHIKNSWSPEYPGGRGQDINFTIGLIQWCFQTLPTLDREFQINDPPCAEWWNIVDNLIKHKNVSTTTMYAEGNPVIESPLSFATSIQDMLLQSWGGKLRVFRGTPKKWADVASKDMRAQGAFLVSAKRKSGVTQFVEVQRLSGPPFAVQTDIPEPKVYINGKPARSQQVRIEIEGPIEIELEKGDIALLTPVELDRADLRMEPVPVDEKDRNLFGLGERTARLPGHQYYYKD